MTAQASGGGMGMDHGAMMNGGSMDHGMMQMHCGATPPCRLAGQAARLRVTRFRQPA